MIEKLTRLIKKRENIVIFTGAGVSTASGIPDFRSPDTGLWNTTSSRELLFIDNFKKNPEEFYDFADKYFRNLLKAEPNSVHNFISGIQDSAGESCVVTQNIDNLHQKAGSFNIIELHGNFSKSFCLSCGHQMETTKIFRILEKGENPPKCTICKGLMKPDVTFFGESLPHEALDDAVSASKKCDLFMVMGSSLVVNPAALMPGYAKSAGADIVILNRDETPYDSIADIVIHDDLVKTATLLNEEIYGQKL